MVRPKDFGADFFEPIGLEGIPQKQSPLGLSLDCLQSDTAEVMQSSWSLVKAVEQQIHLVSA